MKMEGGAMALALGAGYRHENVSDPGTPGTYEGNILGYGYAASSGTRNVWDAFAELYMPIFKNLELTAAIRVDDYSDFGSTWNPLVQAKWAVVPQSGAAGNVRHGLPRTGAGGARPWNSANVGGFTSYVDPLRCPITDASADCGGGNTGIATVGNANIKPETSRTWTAGVVWEPMSGLSATVDYWWIKTRNQIQAPDTQAILNNPAAFPNDTITRDTTDNLPGIPNSGTVLLINGAYENVSSVMTNGIDVDVLWKINTAEYGRFTPEIQWVRRVQFQADAQRRDDQLRRLAWPDVTQQFGRQPAGQDQRDPRVEHGPVDHDGNRPLRRPDTAAREQGPVGGQSVPV